MASAGHIYRARERVLEKHFDWVKRRRALLAMSAVSVFWASADRGAHGATVSWLDQYGGVWSYAPYWSSNPALPGPSDDVVIDWVGETGGLVEVASGSATVRSMVNKKGLLMSGGTLTLAAASSVRDAYLQGGTLTGTGDLTMSGVTTLTGTIMSGTGKTIVPAGATFRADWSDIRRSIENAGAMTFGGSYTSQLSGMTLTNQAGGTLTIANQGLGVQSGTVTINNAGVMKKTGTTDAGIWATTFTNTGTVRVEKGSLGIWGPSTFAAGSSVEVMAGTTFSATGTLATGASFSGAGTLVLYGGTVEGAALDVGALRVESATTFTGPRTFSMPFALMAGNPMTVAGDVTFAGTGVTIGGTIDGSGRVTLAPGSAVAMDDLIWGAAFTRAVDNYGTATVRKQSITLQPGGAFNNKAGATLNVSGPGYIWAYAGTPGVVNEGTFNKTGTETFTMQTPLSNKGVVNVSGGRLKFEQWDASAGLGGGAWNLVNGAVDLPAFTFVTSIGPTESVKLDGQLASFPALQSGLSEVEGAFTITNGRRFVTSTGFSTFTNSGVITVGPSSALSVSGKLDNAAGRIVLDGGLFVMNYDRAPSEIDAVRGELRKGYAGGSWAGASGIVSLQAAADPQHRTAMGYGEAARVFGLGASQITSYAGLNVDSTAVVTKYTYLGDANLNGRVDLDDYALIDRGFARHVADAHWADGDFNYDGVVDGGDYLLMDRVFMLQGGKLEPGVLAMREAMFGEGYVGALLTSVPEPGGLAMMAGAAFGVAHRTRRRRAKFMKRGTIRFLSND